MNLSAITQDMESAHDAYHARIQAIADRLFETVVKPFCQRNRVHFIAGNGTSFFYRPNVPGFDADSAWTTADRTDVAKPRAPRGWQDILDIDHLRIPGNTTDSLLCYMPDFPGKK